MLSDPAIAFIYLSNNFKKQIIIYKMLHQEDYGTRKLLREQSPFLPTRKYL